MKVTKKQYDDYSLMAYASNSIQHTLSDLHAHVEFLQRSQNVEALNALKEDLSNFLFSVVVSFKNTLSDEC